MVIGHGITLSNIGKCEDKLKEEMKKCKNMSEYEYRNMASNMSKICTFIETHSCLMVF